MQQSRGSALIVVVIVLLAFLTVAATSFAFYFWWKSENAEPSAVATMTTIPTTTVVPTTITPTSTTTPITTTTPTISSTPTPSPTVSTTDQTPKNTVEKFMNATLGTLPPAHFDSELARSYMTEALKAQYTDEVWVPMFYGIQDGPSSVKFISQNVVGDTAYVRFDAIWGTMSLGWMFTLEKVGDTWLISGFSNDAQ